MNIRRIRLWNTQLPRFTLASSMLVLASGPAFAESATELSEVVVTGYRGSLARALGDKRDENVAIDAIYAEDISKFPDLNLAESLQRLPGVAIARDAGEGRQISVRGLGPQFTRVRINGIEALSTTGSTDAAGGTNRDRAFDFNVFASELFNQIAVRKTSAAEVEEGSLGATVDLRSSRPFDFEGMTLVISGQQGYNDFSEDTAPRGALLFSNTFADGRAGALVSVAYSERKLLDEGASTVRWQNSGNCTTTPAGCFLALGPGYATSGSTATLAQINAAFRPRLPRYDKYIHEQERLGITGSLQFRMGESTMLSIDGLYSKFDAQRTEIFLQAPVFSTNGAQAINAVLPNAAEIDSTNTLVYGLFDNVDIRSEARFDELSTEFMQYTAELTHEFSDNVKLRVLAGIAESEHDNPVQTTLLFDALNISGYSFDYRENSRLPVISYGSAAVTDPAFWTLSQIRLRPQSADNDLTTAMADLEWKTSENTSLAFGAQWKKYEFATAELRRSNGTLANLETNIPASVAATPRSQYSQLINLEVGAPSGTTRTWLVPDINAANALFDLYNTANFPMGPEPALGNNRSVKEEDTGAYVQLNFRSSLGGKTLRGNVGVRYVETDQTTTGYVFTAGAPLLTSVSRSYNDTLPALNLALEATDNVVLRLGAAKVMTRPGLGSLNPGAAVSVSGNNRTVNAGNPLLDPFEADAYDLAFEWYFAPEALFSVALFYKDIGSFVQTIRETRPFTGNPLGLPDSVAIAACGATPGCDASVDWQFNLPANTPGGSLEGFEISLQTPFTFLPAPFNSFGTILNYTKTDSTVQYLNATGALVARETLTGLSKNAYNATLYYERGKFQARVSAAYRDEYLTTVPGRNGNDVEGTADTMTVDFSTSWSPNDQLTFTLEGLNLTNEPNDQWVDSAGNRLSFYHLSGRQFFLGARYRF